MAGEFESTPYDGHHPLFQGNDWRQSGPLDRLVSYGNWAGPGNRMDHDPAIAARIKADPSYDPYTDPSVMNRPEFRTIDGMDAAAKEHDHGYFKNLHEEQGNSMFGWDGMHNVREDDRRLVNATQAEMDTNGGRYSFGAREYSQGLRGFFGGRVQAQDAADWVGNKAGEVGSGVSNFVNGARNWNGVGDAARGIGNGVMDAGRWGLNTLGEGVGGLARGAWDFAKLDPVGQLARIGGFANVAVAGGINLAGKAWDGLKSAGGAVANGVSSAAQWAGNGISNAAQGAMRLGGQAWDGAKAVGSSVVNGVSNAASAAGTAISNGAGAVMNGARQVGGAVVNGVSSAASAVGHGVSSAASAVGNGAKAVGGAVAGGVSRAWNWLTH